MKAIPRYELSKAEKRAFHHEVARQTRKITDRFALELDATILWAAHEKWGKGKKSLREFYDFVTDCREQVLKRYEMEDDAEFILLYKLREIGVDLKAWSEEKRNHLVFHIDEEL
jgi:hypothetical protein